MKTLILSIFVLFISATSQATSLACKQIFEKFGTEAVVLKEPKRVSQAPLVPVKLGKPANKEQIQPIRLAQGETFWGLYDCKSCGRTNTMKPNPEGRIQCVGCGVPRTDESYRRPALFEKDGYLWLVDPGQLSRTQQEKELADNGELIGCPFCGNGDFKLSGSCSSCGAKAENPSDLRSMLGSLKSGTSSLGLGSSTTSNRRTTVSPRITSLQDGAAPNFLTPMRKKVLGMAAGITLAAATTLGTVWGTTTYSEVGRVIDVDTTQVVIEYTVDSQRYTVELARPSGETLQWRMGEPVTLSFVNWKMGDPSGGIRGNGDVLPMVPN